MRPFIGFVVEGDAEYQSFRTILAVGLGLDTRNVPIANAAGCGSLMKDLELHLADLTRLWQPTHIVVTIDARDFRKIERFQSCIALREHLQERANTWLSAARAEGQFPELPLDITVVVQDRCFESWLIADLEGLRKLPELVQVEDHITWINVDSEVPNPAQWLDSRVRSGVDAKSPFFAKKVAKQLNPALIAAHSRSFKKFWKEITRCCAA